MMTSVSPGLNAGLLSSFFEYNDREREVGFLIGTYLFILFFVLLLFAFNSVDMVIISADHAHWYAVHCDNYIFDNLDGIDINPLFLSIYVRLYLSDVAVRLK